MSIVIGKDAFEKNVVEGTLTLTCNDENLFKTNSGIDWDVMKSYDKYKDDYLKEVLTQSAAMAEEEMTADSKINKVIVSVPYTTSKRGSAEVVVDRSKTFRNLSGGDDIVKSTLKLNVEDPYASVSKPFIKGLEAKLTEALLK